MDGLRDCYTESEKAKYRITLLICGSKERVQMNLLTKQKQSHRCRRQTSGYQGGMWGEG